MSTKGMGAGCSRLPQAGLPLGGSTARCCLPCVLSSVTHASWRVWRPTFMCARLFGKRARRGAFGERACGGALAEEEPPLPQACFTSARAQDPEGKYEALAKYARDLTEAARDGKLDPVIGRDDEIRRCIQILSRRTKNNPVLIGEPGVGKTAVAEGARRRAGGA